MWTLKIVLLAAGVTVTAFISNLSADDVRCAVAQEIAGMTAATSTATADTHTECLPG